MSQIGERIQTSNKPRNIREHNLKLVLQLFRQAARDFADAYCCASAINNYFIKAHNWSCSDEEMLYLMMHINRLRSS